MKILLFAPGVSIHSKRYLQSLLDEGCQVVFVDTHNPIPEGRKGYKFFFYGTLRGRRLLSKIIGINLSRLIYESNWLSISQLYLLWKLVKPDIVHVHYVDYRAISCVKAGLKPLVLTVWGSDVNYHFLADANTGYKLLVGKALAKADLVIVDAPDMVEKVSTLAGSKVRIEVITMGVDINAFKPGYKEQRLAWRKTLSIPENAMVLLSPRGWNRHYRHEIILQAYVIARERMGVESYLVFKKFSSSPDFDKYQEELLVQAEQLGVKPWVRLLPEVEFTNMPEIYAMADIIINYPDVDAFPVTFLEAAACERPVVSGLLPSYNNTFAEKFFKLVNPSDIKSLAQGILDVSGEDQSGQSKRMAEARKLIIKEFDESLSIHRIVDLYKEIIR
jgi:glycosyltransferase involved in cell wall biosynthesis